MRSVAVMLLLATVVRSKRGKKGRKVEGFKAQIKGKGKRPPRPKGQKPATQQPPEMPPLLPDSGDWPAELAQSPLVSDVPPLASELPPGVGHDPMLVFKMDPPKLDESNTTTTTTTTALRISVPLSFALPGARSQVDIVELEKRAKRERATLRLEDAEEALLQARRREEAAKARLNRAAGDAAQARKSAVDMMGTQMDCALAGIKEHELKEAHLAADVATKRVKEAGERLQRVAKEVAGTIDLPPSILPYITSNKSVSSQLAKLDERTKQDGHMFAHTCLHDAIILSAALCGLCVGSTVAFAVLHTHHFSPLLPRFGIAYIHTTSR
eukprot:gnl/MRDRNA2_/MRDRNA2_27869_c0_seq1.p1 gnl/MRDRNA2_/MRDRNA2_27869_c0~~gnl/MRDRNA2_/MRDRNA2_27869_c0_seq1.p1  ORF type:complete len:326 (-),score=65.97 gnl/MRDRNA2_/MRDRNA2_27869_c0_seq1:27-1004(-)